VWSKWLDFTFVEKLRINIEIKSAGRKNGTELESGIFSGDGGFE
jgi:hypothetical protein